LFFGHIGHRPGAILDSILNWIPDSILNSILDSILDSIPDLNCAR
jgi:hypothetical protein